MWYFGNDAGLDFNSGSPVAVTNGAMYGDDNTASIADSTGKILFYSNGVSVWNKNHVPMPNGTGLDGASSGGQPATIVPKPGSNTIYYLFTVDGMAGPNGLHYSIIDMSLQSGLGDVSSKNNLLLSVCSEKVTATVQKNGSDYWLVTHGWNSNSFYSYPITSSGVGTPVISNVGTVHSGGSSPGYNAMGQMEISPDGSKLALGIYDLGNVELYDFDNATGVVSNPVIITTGVYSHIWGIEFSSNNSVLYMTTWFYDPVYQFDLSSGIASTIAASATIVGHVTSPSGYKAGYLQMGPDKKIYVAKYTSTYIGCINNPDSLGTKCNFIDNGVYLGGKVCQAGLPNAIKAKCAFPTMIDTLGCLGDSSLFQLSFTQNVNSVSWNFGDPSSSNNTSSSTHPKHLFSAAGTYVVKTLVSTPCTTDTIKKIITVNPLPTPIASVTGSTTFCYGANTVNSNYSSGNQWYFNGDSIGSATSQNYAAGQSGFYSVKVTDSNGCTGTSSFVSVNILPSPTAAISCSGKTSGQTFKMAAGCTFCLGTSVTLNATGGGTYAWSTGSTDDSTKFTPLSSGPYTVTVTASNGCTATATQVVTVNPIPPTPTITQNVNVLASSSSTNNQWYLDGVPIVGATGQFYTATATGDYKVEVTNGSGCSTPSTTIHIIITGISELNGNNDIRIYPNPNNGMFSLSYYSEKNQSLKIELINTIGQVIYSKQLTVTSGANILSMQLESAASGVYFIRIQSDNTSSQHKLLIN